MPRSRQHPARLQGRQGHRRAVKLWRPVLRRHRAVCPRTVRRPARARHRSQPRSRCPGAAVMRRPLFRSAKSLNAGDLFYFTEHALTASGLFRQTRKSLFQARTTGDSSGGEIKCHRNPRNVQRNYKSRLSRTKTNVVERTCRYIIPPDNIYASRGDMVTKANSTFGSDCAKRRG